jgi:hypothetical protein
MGECASAFVRQCGRAETAKQVLIDRLTTAQDVQDTYTMGA